MRRACDRRVSRTRYDGRCETSASSGLRSAIGADLRATTCSIRRCWVWATRGGAPSGVRVSMCRAGAVPDIDSTRAPSRLRGELPRRLPFRAHPLLRLRALAVKGIHRLHHRFGVEAHGISRR